MTQPGYWRGGQGAMSDTEAAELSAIDQAPALIRGHRRSGLSKATAKAIADKSTKLEAQDIASVRESFRGMFGNATGDQALRQIDQRIRGGKEITGEHVQTAAVAAMEMLSPLIRCGKAVATAEAAVKSADKRLSNAKAKLAAAQREKDEDDSRYEPGTFQPGVRSDREKSAKALKEAEKEAADALAEKKAADESLETANRNLDTCRKSLDASFDPGEDEVALLKRRDVFENAVISTTVSRDEAAEAVKAAQAELDTRLKDREEARQGDNYFSDSLNPGVQKPVEEAQAKLDDAKAKLAGAEKERDEALDDLRGLDAQYSALMAGPGLRRAQVLLDNLGGDPRLQKEMAETAPSSLGEKAKAKIKTATTPKELGKTAIGLVPLASTFTKYAEMVGHEDTERRLGAATDRLGATPMAASMAQVLERDAEISKDKAGLSMAIGFVASGISASIPGIGGSALNALIGPALTPLSSAVAGGTAHALGETASGLLGSGVAWGIKWTGKKIMTEGASTALGQIAPDQIAADRSKLAEQLSQSSDVAVPEGTAMPMIPKPDGSGEAWPLSDPNVAKALLAYLGPGQDQAMLRDPAKRDMEERRLLLREQTFGTPRDVDLSPGRAATELDKRLVETLDKGRSGGGSVGPMAPPLQVLQAALGWVGT